MISNPAQDAALLNENSNLIPRTGNGLIFRPFRFIDEYSKQNSKQAMAKYVTWKPPKLYKGKRWLVEYQYRIPEELRHLHKGAKWKRFQVFEDINRNKSDEYAQTLLRAVEIVLEGGFNPFTYQTQMFAKVSQDIHPSKEWTIIQGLNYFLQQWEERGNEKRTIENYKRAVGHLVEWLKFRNMQNFPAGTLQKKHVELALQEASKVNSWENRTYNNNLSFLRTALKFMTDEGMIPKNPGAGVTKKKSKSQKHKFYDEKKFTLVRKLMGEHDPLLFFAARIVYYLCIRSAKELRLFKVGNIFPERRQVLIQAEDAKTDSDRFIPIPDELLPELTAMREAYPDTYYVIGKPKGHKFVAGNKPAAARFGNNFLSKRFSKIRGLAGLSNDYTLYGFKHTRIIHLKQDGGQDADIMGLTGHTSYEAYSAYLRDLGVDANPEAINKISRKF